MDCCRPCPLARRPPPPPHQSTNPIIRLFLVIFVLSAAKSRLSCFPCISRGSRFSAGKPSSHVFRVFRGPQFAAKNKMSRGPGITLFKFRGDLIRFFEQFILLLDFPGSRCEIGFGDIPCDGLRELLDAISSGDPGSHSAE